MSSRLSTYTGDDLVVHKQSDFVADCVCNGTDPIKWTGNAATTERTDFVNSLTIGRSRLKLRNASKQDEGQLCCVQSGHSDCRHLLVVDKPVVTLSGLGEIECRNSRDKGSKNVSIQCNMTSAIHTDFLQGFMQVFKNKKDTVSYDNSPSNSTRQDASGNTLYTMAYEFSEEMLYGDSLDCRWTREDGNVLESETKFVIEFCKSLEPPTSFDIKLTSEAPETNTTMDTITERQGNRVTFSVNF